MCNKWEKSDSEKFLIRVSLGNTFLKIPWAQINVSGNGLFEQPCWKAISCTKTSICGRYDASFRCYTNVFNKMKLPGTQFYIINFAYVWVPPCKNRPSKLKL